MGNHDNGIFDKLKEEFDKLFGADEPDDGASDLKGLFSSSEEDDTDDDLNPTVMLTDENGVEHMFEFLDLITYEGEEYVVLLPMGEDEDEVVILRLEETDNDDEESYTSVDDETTLNTVFRIFKEKFKDEFNFVD